MISIGIKPDQLHSPWHCVGRSHSFADTKHIGTRSGFDPSHKPSRHPRKAPIEGSLPREGNMNLTDKTIIKEARDRQVSTNFDDEVIIMETEKGLYYQLNEVGAVIWRTIQRTPSRVPDLV